MTNPGKIFFLFIKEINYPSALDNSKKKLYNIFCYFRGVAQFGRALRSGRRSRRFKSCHLDQKNGIRPLARCHFLIDQMAEPKTRKGFKSEKSVDNYISFRAIHLFQS